jgi:hypothetical protein
VGFTLPATYKQNMDLKPDKPGGKKEVTVLVYRKK